MRLRAQHRTPLPGRGDEVLALVGAQEPDVVEVSYDDGATWTRVRADHRDSYRLDAPRKARFASLRVSADDSAGNSVEQTVIRAVGLR